MKAPCIFVGGLALALSAAACAKDSVSDTAVRANPEVVVMPPQCHGKPNDAIYVALGEDVFRIPGTPNHVGIYPIPYPKRGEASSAMSGDALPGCPDHPARAFSLHLAQHQSSILGNLQDLPPGALRAINVSRVGHLPYGERFAMNTLAMMVKDEPCRDAGEGLVECSKQPDQERGTSTLSAQASVYGTPLGHPFIVTCGFGPGIWASDCQVHYQLSERLELGYQLDRRRVPAERMIEVDRAIRAGVQRLLMNSRH
ncbi:hypothetical protein ACVWWQ_003233 [Rhodanobacter sp. TND4EL1]